MNHKEFKKELCEDDKIKKAFEDASNNPLYILERKLKELRIKNGLTVSEFKKLIK